MEMITKYKNINENKIELVGQTNATVRTNKPTLQLPLLITKVINYNYKAINETKEDETVGNNDKLKHRGRQNT